MEQVQSQIDRQYDLAKMFPLLHRFVGFSNILERIGLGDERLDASVRELRHHSCDKFRDDVPLFAH